MVEEINDFLRNQIENGSLDEVKEAAVALNANQKYGCGNWVRRKDLGGPEIPNILSRVLNISDDDVVPLK